MNVITIIGARPQFIKAAAISRAIQAHNQNSLPTINEKIIHTGQHYDQNMSKIFFDELDLPYPDYNLEVSGLSHGAMTGRMLEGIEIILKKEQPDMVLVYGDTNSTLAGALAAKKMHIKVVHIEAGLRSFNMSMPEEVNRILTDQISDILFCPTDTAVSNLKDEGFSSRDVQILKSGDVMQDAAIYYQNRSQSLHRNELPDKFVLATIHRAENTDDIKCLTEIIKALNEISKNTDIILPLHPRTQKIIRDNNLALNCCILEPVGYLEMISLLENCEYVMTDSGGVQKEAFFFNKNCITLRDETEWIELVQHGYNILTGAKERKILESIHNISNMNHDFNINLYGNGKASEMIVKKITQ